TWQGHADKWHPAHTVIQKSADRLSNISDQRGERGNSCDESAKNHDETHLLPGSVRRVLTTRPITARLLFVCGPTASQWGAPTCHSRRMCANAFTYTGCLRRDVPVELAAGGTRTARFDRGHRQGCVRGHTARGRGHRARPIRRQAGHYQRLAGRVSLPLAVARPLHGVGGAAGFWSGKGTGSSRCPWS